MRHMPNFLMYARGRPQSRQRLWNRTRYLGVCFQRSIADFFAKPSYLFSPREGCAFARAPGTETITVAS